MNLKTSLVALILAGGMGKRLRSVVPDRPKPMALVNGVPFLEILIRSIAKKGVKKFVISTGYMSDFIEDHFRNNDLGLNISFSREEEPLGTGGAVKHALKLAADPTLLVNGDTFFDVDLDGLLALHSRERADVTLSLYPVPDVSRYGSVSVDTNGNVLGFCEKREGAGPGLINAGFSALSLDFIKGLPDGPFSMEQEIFPGLAGSGRMVGLPQDRPFFDIGTPDSYSAFVEFVRTNFDMACN
jgi:NDP-sugar pyrophosphorylase family protein